ncbi:hypothetical protein [Zunongwangia sp. HRR-M8]|uniref:hypothetical protein n=1 Tax=Zunongwangia sp. HRR-M8 TaxID=3015170 RepID=UPI0022DDCB20|nr:hypothetical protein [Zunongwangia sp. HRR-M8]WBL22446.1 hypothetical protein PBT89_00455 [Zunongwangia sp. HRR-M8]
MDTYSTIIGLGLFILFIGPILFVLYRQSVKDVRNKKALKDLAKEHNLNLDYTEISNSLVLGLDKKQHKLLVMEPFNAMQHQIIDLSQITKSSIIKRSVSFIHNDSRKNKVIQVSVELKAKSDLKQVTEILFYDEDGVENDDMETRLFTASRWNELIQANL